MTKWKNAKCKNFRVFDKVCDDFEIIYGEYEEGGNNFGNKKYFGVRWLRTQNPRNKNGFSPRRNKNANKGPWVLLPTEILDLMNECRDKGIEICEK